MEGKRERERRAGRNYEALADFFFGSGGGKGECTRIHTFGIVLGKDINRRIRVESMKVER